MSSNPVTNGTTAAATIGSGGTNGSNLRQWWNLSYWLHFESFASVLNLFDLHWFQVM
jgi:hypothetical protein